MSPASFVRSFLHLPNDVSAKHAIESLLAVLKEEEEKDLECLPHHACDKKRCNESDWWRFFASSVQNPLFHFVFSLLVRKSV